MTENCKKGKFGREIWKYWSPEGKFGCRKLGNYGKKQFSPTFFAEPA